MSKKGNKAKKNNDHFHIIDSLKSGVVKIIDALTGDISLPQKLNCLQNQILDFKLIEDDVKAIYEQHEESDYEACVVVVVLEFEKKEIVFDIYIREGQEVFKSTISGKFTQCKNLPDDIQEELKNQKRIVLEFVEEEEEKDNT
jgi:hypothetical protein